MSFPETPKIAVIGLGYVGLPLGVEFSKVYPCVGFDINAARIKQLQAGEDKTLEVSRDELQGSPQLQFTSAPEDLADCDVYVVTVPTPIDKNKRPDLRPLERATELVGGLISKGNIVIYESTVYPGCTEEICIPVIERLSGLTFNQGFFAGYSPERINPGDKEHRVSNIVKVTSGSTPESADYIDALYRRIVTVGTHKASSIKVAEAAKVIENTQRDINIALVNELSLIFNRLHIDTHEVLAAAGSKWNFLPFKPGLVGGHCISVDPYYLTHKAEEVGYHPEVILAGRRINDHMGGYVATCVMKLMTQKRIHLVNANILIMGLAFKENCPDVRNTRVVDIIEELNRYHAHIDVYDPWVSAAEAQVEYGINMVEQPEQNHYDAIILCVGHDQFRDMGAEGIHQLGKPEHVLYDVKGLLEKTQVDGCL